MGGATRAPERQRGDTVTSTPRHQRTASAGSPRGGRHDRDQRQRPIAGSLKLSADHIEAIDRSHDRCAALGVSRIERPDFSPLGRSDLNVARERTRRLLDHAAPVMNMLYDQIVDSQSMVVLTDSAGIIIHAIGDDEFLQRAEKVALRPGGDWSESAKGTNAVGTALVQETPTLVHADEHYLHANHFLTCSAAPILDPRGNMLGVLDVSGDHRGYHQHTMALVKMSARMIENHWLNDDHRNVMRLHFHSKIEFIGTLMEGLLAVGLDGRIVGANRGALEQLGVSGASLRMQTLETLFGLPIGALVDRFRSPLTTPMPVHSRDGRQFHILARFDWPVWSNLAEAISVPREAAAAAAPKPATAPAVRQATPLERLRTGEPQVDALLDKIGRTVDRDIPLVIVGETGTGKAELARAVHASSRRAGQPFVALDCTSMTSAQLEAELLGREEASPTGNAVPGLPGAPIAARRKASVGRIVQASGGTLFLREVGELPPPLQAQLLRVLQERQVVPAGSTKAVAVDVSFICATRRPLREQVDAGRFRQDLYYRLNGLTVRLPPLRERTDVLDLVARQLDRGPDLPVLRLAPEVRELLVAYAWPGNLRELHNVLRAATALAGDEPEIRVEHLAEEFAEEAARALARQAEPVIAPDRAATLQAQEVELIRRAVDAAGGNISAASKQLGISRNKIYRKLRWTQG
jgi:transcriptional regulator of acetoin/glycerol metabolism